MSISRKSIQDVIETARIEDVVGDFVHLKKAGPRYKGLCPFHHEKTPSFTVTPTTNLYICFGCGKGGDSVEFLQEHEQFGFIEAIRWLANKYGIELEETHYSKEQQEKYKKEESLYIVNEFAQAYFEGQLFDTQAGRSIGLAYFKERGFLEETIKKFGLGYASAQPDGLLLAAKSKGYQEEFLKDLGLISKSYGKDFFRDRVMFPIHRMSGKVVAFAGRIMGSNKKAPKYINSPETPIYTKSKLVYGIYQAKKEIRKQDECLLVEGYTDVISLHQNGIENVVASSGTALTRDQLNLIKRNTNNLKIIYDGDPAGINAALRGLDLALEEDLNVKIVLLPEGEDPDSYMRKVGSTVFKDFITDKAEDFIFFKINLLEEQTAHDPVKRTEMIKDLVASIGKIPDPIKRGLYTRECGIKLQINEELLTSAVNQVVLDQVTKFKKEQLRTSKGQAPLPQEESPFPSETPYNSESEIPIQKVEKPIDTPHRELAIIRVLVQHGDKELLTENMTVAKYVLSQIGEMVAEFKDEAYRKMGLFCIELVSNGELVNYLAFQTHEDRDVRILAQEIVNTPYKMSDNWANQGITLRSQPKPEVNHRRDTINEILRYKLHKLEEIAALNQQKLKEAPEGKIGEILRVQQNIVVAIQEITQQLKQVVLK